MKKIYFSTFLLFACLSGKAQLFQQLFPNRVAGFTNSALVDANYVSILTPTSSQFTCFASGHSSATLSVPDATDDATAPFTLKAVTTSSSSIWALGRNVNYATVPTSLKITFDLNITPGSTGSNPKWFFYVGNGFANTVTQEADANVHSGFAIRYSSSTAPGQYTIRPLNGTESSNFAGGTSRTITFAINNSGSALTYTDPNGATESVANDTWDLWVGTTKLFNDQAATTATQAINNFKFGDLVNSSAGRANMYVDNLVVANLVVTTPVTIASLNAYQKNNGIQVDWSTASEINLNNFLVEKSVDGINYAAATSLNAKGSSNAVTNYTWYDAAPNNGNNFYRIKSVDKDGSFKYSNVLKVAIGKVKAEMVIAPNPVKNAQLNLQLSSLEKGNYTMKAINSAGQIVASKVIGHEGGSAAYTINLPQLVKAGSYTLVLQNGDTRITKQFMVE